MHHADSEKSARLKRVLRVLRGRRSPISSWQLTADARTVAVGTCVSELRANGYAIECERADGVYWYRLLGKADA